MLFNGPIPRHLDPLQTGVDEAPAAEQNELTAAGEINPARPETVLRLPSGKILVIPTEVLLEVGNISGESGGQSTGRSAARPIAGQSAIGVHPATPPFERIIPLAEERAEITKHLVETAKVRIYRSTETFNQTVTLPLTSTAWNVERIPVGELVPNRPEVRQEGETTIYPLVEERFVAKREYFLIEEVRVTRTAKTAEQTATLELQRDVLAVERQSLTNDDL